MKKMWSIIQSSLSENNYNKEKMNLTESTKITSGDVTITDFVKQKLLHG
jgi:hypothetical protein